MALITRVARLFRADFHAVLDRIEEPDVLLRQAVREMDEAVTHDQQRWKALNREHRQLVARENEIEQAWPEIDEKLDVCFRSEKDDLARMLIRRKLESQQLLKVISGRRAEAQRSLAALTARLEENRSRLDSMRQKAEILAAETAPEAADDGFPAPNAAIRDEDVEVAFLREKQKRRPS